MGLVRGEIGGSARHIRTDGGGVRGGVHVARRGRCERTLCMTSTHGVLYAACAAGRCGDTGQSSHRRYRPPTPAAVRDLALHPCSPPMAGPPIGGSGIWRTPEPHPGTVAVAGTRRPRLLARSTPAHAMETASARVPVLAVADPHPAAWVHPCPARRRVNQRSQCMEF